MATAKAVLEGIVSKLSETGDVRTRSMMGEYLLYVDETLVGQVNDNELYLKITSYGEGQLAEKYKVSPYPGARLAFKIPLGKMNDVGWLTEFVQKTRSALVK